MIRSFTPIYQACIGTLLTWGLTAAGAAVVVFFKGTQQKLLDGSLGFAAGVMLAASYWSLLEPALEMAENSELYGKHGEYSFAPVALGFLLGALFVFGTDIALSSMNINSSHMMVVLAGGDMKKKEENPGFSFPTKTKESIMKDNWRKEETVDGITF